MKRKEIINMDFYSLKCVDSALDKRTCQPFAAKRLVHSRAVKKKNKTKICIYTQTSLRIHFHFQQEILNSVKPSLNYCISIDFVHGVRLTHLS